MPAPTVLATAVPKPNAATKLKNAAQTTALPGRQHPGRDDRGDRVGRVVEAVDVVEDEGDCNQRQDGEERGVHPSAVLDDDAFEQVGDVLAPVGGGLEEVEDLLPLDDGDRVALRVEQLDDRVLVARDRPRARAA